MNAKQFLILGVTLFVALFGAEAMGEEMLQQYIQIAEIDVDSAQLDGYKAAVKEQIEAAIRLEPGVLVLYSVSSKDNPTHVTVFEIYRDREAYRAHLQTPHFLKYKATVETMVKSLKLILEGNRSTERTSTGWRRSATRSTSAEQQFATS
jgi:quinol monooxygenase YgiN